VSLRMAWFAIALIGMTVTAGAQPQVPSDLELSVAYCLGQMKDESLLAELEQIAANDPDPNCKMSAAPDYVAICRKGQQALPDLRRDIGRLQTYLLARGFGTWASKTLPYTMAINRGKADAADWKARVNSAEGRACFSRCLAGGADCTARCVQQLDTGGINARMGQCQGVLRAIPF
jgi:hypothetical protein